MTPASLADLIIARGGVARSRSLLAAGATRFDLRRAIAARSVIRLREGVYATPSADPLVIAAAEHGGELACASALRARGVWVLDPDHAVHVWVGGHGRRFRHSGCRCVTHFDDGSSAFGVVSVVRALIQIAECAGDESFFAAFESAWHRGLLDRSDRAEIRAGIRAGQRWLVDIARADAESGLESLVRIRLLRLGMWLEAQVKIPTVGRVDFVIDGILIIEADGRPGHEKEADRHKDHVRDARAAVLGYETLRFDYALIVHDWAVVQAAILAALARIRRASRRSVGAGVTA